MTHFDRVHFRDQSKSGTNHDALRTSQDHFSDLLKVFKVLRVPHKHAHQVPHQRQRRPQLRRLPRIRGSIAVDDDEGDEDHAQHDGQDRWEIRREPDRLRETAEVVRDDVQDGARCHAGIEDSSVVQMMDGTMAGWQRGHGRAKGEGDRRPFSPQLKSRRETPRYRPSPLDPSP